MDLAVLNLVVKSKSVAQANRALGRFTKAAGRAEGATSAFNKALLALAAATAAFGVAAIKQFARIEKLEITLRTLIGTAEETKVVMDDLRDLAAVTPISFQQLAESTALLKAFGTETERLIPDLIALSDAAAGLGGNAPNVALERFVRNLGEIRSQGKLDNEDLRRLAELRIPNLLNELVTIFQVEDVFTFRKAVEAGRVGAEDAIEAIFDILRRSTGGLNQEIAQTVSGSFQVLLNNVALEMEKLGGAINSALDLQGIFEKAIPFVKEYLTLVTQVVQVLFRRGVTGELDKRALAIADALRKMAVAVEILIKLQLALWLTRVVVGLKAMGIALLSVNPITAWVAVVGSAVFVARDLVAELVKLDKIAKRPALTQEDAFDNRRIAAIRDAEAAIAELGTALVVHMAPESGVGPELVKITDAGREVLEVMRELRATKFPDLSVDLLGTTPQTRVAAAFQELANIRKRLTALLEASARTTTAPEADPLRFDIRAERRESEFAKLKVLERDALHELRTINLADHDKELADTILFFEEKRRLWKDDAKALAVLRRAERATTDAIDAEFEIRREVSLRELRQLESDSLHEMRTLNLSTHDRELADTLRFFEEKRRLHEDDADAILAIRRAERAALDLLDAAEAKRQRELRTQFAGRLTDLKMQQRALGLSPEGAERLTFQIEAQAEAMKAFGDDAAAAARAVEEIMEQFDLLADASRLERVFADLEAGIKNAVTSGLEAAIFDESWQEALMAAFRQIASNALGSVVDGLSDILLGKTNGNQNSLLGALGGLFGGGGPSGPDLGGVIPTPGFDVPAAPGAKQGNVLVTMVPDVATADAVLAKASSQGLSTAFAAGAGRGGIKAGRIKAGRR